MRCVKAVRLKIGKKCEYVFDKSEIASELKKIIHALQHFSAGFQHLEETFVMYKMFMLILQME